MVTTGAPAPLPTSPAYPNFPVREKGPSARRDTPRSGGHSRAARGVARRREPAPRPLGPQAWRLTGRPRGAPPAPCWSPSGVGGDPRVGLADAAPDGSQGPPLTAGWGSGDGTLDPAEAATGVAALGPAVAGAGGFLRGAVLWRWLARRRGGWALRTRAGCGAMWRSLQRLGQDTQHGALTRGEGAGQFPPLPFIQ